MLPVLDGFAAMGALFTSFGPGDTWVGGSTQGAGEQESRAGPGELSGDRVCPAASALAPARKATTAMQR